MLNEMLARLAQDERIARLANRLQEAAERVTFQAIFESEECKTLLALFQRLSGSALSITPYRPRESSGTAPVSQLAQGRREWLKSMPGDGQTIHSFSVTLPIPLQKLQGIIDALPECLSEVPELALSEIKPHLRGLRVGDIIIFLNPEYQPASSSPASDKPDAPEQPQLTGRDVIELLRASAAKEKSDG